MSRCQCVGSAPAPPACNLDVIGNPPSRCILDSPFYWTFAERHHASSKFSAEFLLEVARLDVIFSLFPKGVVFPVVSSSRTTFNKL